MHLCVLILPSYPCRKRGSSNRAPVPHVLAIRTVIHCICAAAFGLLAAACTVAPTQNQWPEITYKHRPPLRFDVGQVVIDKRYSEPLAPPNVEHLIPVPPAALAGQWARDRLVAAGSVGRLVYTIQDASVVETPLNTKSGIEGLFTVDQSERYEAHLAVQVHLEDIPGLARASVSAVAERWVTVPEDATLNEREATWFALSEALMNDLDVELERVLYQYMATHILN